MPDATPVAAVVIPARGGSKGIPRKNLRKIGGVPLVVRAVHAGQAASNVATVVVSTDDDEIASLAKRAGALVIRRPAALATDEASSESAVLHALDALEAAGVAIPPITVLVQCTSPFINSDDLDQAIESVAQGVADVVMSVVPTHSFLWREAADTLVGVNHEASVRLRRQDSVPQFRETGAFYAMSTAGLRSRQHRFFGRVKGQRVAEATAIDIDTMDDLDVARLLEHRHPGARMDVDAVVTDFDGVHTDDSALVHSDGSESVRVLRKDGMGIALVREAGVQVLIISTETNPVVSVRARKLGVPVVQAANDKAAVLEEWMDAQSLNPSRVAYLGNDVNDVRAMSLVGWPVAVADAHPTAMAAARVVLDRGGGQGAVRELCDRVLRDRGAVDDER